MNWTIIQEEIQIADIGAPLLANLAKGIYTPDNVLREYVQNAADALMALADAPEPSTITISLDPLAKSISIFDKGVGMDKNGVLDAKKIAVSPQKPGGDFVGFRGIGIWAGFQACAKLELETKKAGDPNKYRLEIDFADILPRVNDNISIKALLDRKFRVSSQQAAEVDKKTHYTSVTLKGLHDDYMRLANEVDVRRIVSQNLPCLFDPSWSSSRKVSDKLRLIDGYREFEIVVNGQPVYKDFPKSDLAEPQFLSLAAEDETELGLVWWCESEQDAIRVVGNQFRSFRLRVKNFAVGPVGIFDDEDGSAWGVIKTRQLKGRGRLGRFIGEIHITNSDIRPDTPRNNLELSPIARQAIDQTRIFYSTRINEAGARSSSNSAGKKLSEAEGFLASGVNDAAQALRHLNDLNPAHAALTGKAQANTERKFLKDFLLPQKKRIEKARRALESIAAQAAKPEKRKESRTNQRRSSGGVPANSNGEPPRPAVMEIAMEELCSEIIEAISTQLDDVEVLAILSQLIADLFRQRNLIPAR